jgi:lipopolysaccharide export system ATP-binding protein
VQSERSGPASHHPKLDARKTSSTCGGPATATYARSPLTFGHMQTASDVSSATPSEQLTPGRLSATGLRKSYGGRMVVQDVSLSVNSGEVVGLLGPNGAGKTTSFYMIVGLVAADAGRIEIDDTSISSMPIHQRARRGVSYLPQDASVFRRLTVEENIRAVLELQIDHEGKKFSKTMIEQQLDSLLEELQITHIRRNSALSLSGGERRRVEISRALATRPRFILLDEPFAGVDPIAVIEIQRIVRFLKSRGIGVLITDHNVRETLGICDRAYIISEGKVLTTGKPEDIINDASVRKVYLGEHFKM